MICVACGKTCDPTRSFCRNCGSSVFVHQGAHQPAWSATSASVSQASPSAPTVNQPSRQADTVKARPRPGPTRPGSPRAARQPAPAPAAVGAVVGLVRLIIAAGVVWFVGSALLGVPEIRTLKNALQQGDQTQIESAVQGVRSWFQSRLSSVSGDPVTPEPAPGDDSRRPTAPSDNGTVSDVYEPGDGVTMPTPTERVNPDYTPDARRRKIEGTVLLTCVVRPDFTVSDVEVVRSLDAGLDEEAVKALKQWRFSPGRRNGRFVPVRVNVQMTFTLQ